MEIYSGIVEDRHDPLELCRYRVRVFGLHSHDKTEIPTEALPWANTLQPTTSAAINGVGETPRLIVGTNVIVTFFDKDMQNPLILGSIPGVSTESHLVFNGQPMPNDNNQFGFTSGSNAEYVGQSDVSKGARSGANDKPEASIKVDSPGGFEEPIDKRYARMYPMNSVKQTESGHVQEYDDTPGNERIRTQHATGTKQEMLPDGSHHTKIFGERYTVIAKGDNVYVEGNCNVHINSSANIYVEGDYNLNVKGDYNLNVAGDQYVNVIGDITETSDGFKSTMTGNGIVQVSAGDIEIGSTQEINITAAEDLTMSSVGDMNIGSSADITVGAKADLDLFSNGNIHISGTGCGVFDTKGFMKLMSGGVCELGSTGAMNIGSAAAVRMNGSTIDLNDGGSAPAIKSLTPEIPAFGVPEFESPGIEFPSSVIYSVEPDLDLRSTQRGTTTSSDYRNQTQGSYGGGGTGGGGTGNYDNTYSSTYTGSGYAGNFKVTPEIYKLLQFISKGEGGYDAANNGTIGNSIVSSTMNYRYRDGRKLSELTVQEILDMQMYPKDRGQGRQIFAVGAYQIIPGTMLKYALPESGVKATDIFNRDTQDAMGIALLIGTKRRALGAYLTGKSDNLFEAHMDFAREWASIPRPDTGKSYYGSGNSANNHKNNEVKQALIDGRKAFMEQAKVADRVAAQEARPSGPGGMGGV